MIETTMDTLLKEAIAEAKLIKETAYANAKAALEEAFTPQIKELLSKKLRAEAEGEEMDDEPVVHDLEDESPEHEAAENAAEEGDDGLDEIFEKLREDLEGSEEPADDEGAEHEFDLEDEAPAPEAAPAEPAPEGEDFAPEAPEAPVDDEVSFDDEEPFDDEDEINLDFDDESEEGGEEFAPEAPAPEGDEFASEEPAPEAAPEGEPAPEEESFPEGDLEQEEGMSPADFEDDDEDSIGGIEPFGKSQKLGDSERNRGKMSPQASDSQPEFDADDEEDLDIEEVLREYEMESEDDETPEEDESMESQNEELTNKLQQTEAELREHRKVIKYLRSKLNEVNLLNSKLLYTNKLFKDNSLNMNQKVQVVEAFDAASNVKEAKSVYKTLSEVFAGIKAKRTEKAERIVEGLASKPIASTKPSEQIISEGNSVATRFQVLAGLRKRSI